MKLVKSIEEFTAPSPIALTIGFFDGVHTGHQKLLSKLQKHGTPVVITFENHPAEVLRPESAPLKICSLAHKIKLIEESGVSTLILLTFTRAFSQQTAEDFLRHLSNKIPFETLLLGSDATLGKDKQGDRAHLQQLSRELQFHLECLELYTSDGAKISSSAIRESIKAGELAKAEHLLGRKFSIYAPIHTGAGLGKKIGFPTLNMPVIGLCLPPLGVYAVTLKSGDRVWKGVANLGIAPTVRNDREPTLEVHLFDYDATIHDQDFCEVIFEHYLRPEKKFSGIEELKNQIAQDILKSKEVFHTFFDKKESRCLFLFPLST